MKWSFCSVELFIGVFSWLVFLLKVPLGSFFWDPPTLGLNLGKAVVCDLPYVVNHAIEQPLDIHFDFAP